MVLYEVIQNPGDFQDAPDFSELRNPIENQISK